MRKLWLLYLGPVLMVLLVSSAAAQDIAHITGETVTTPPSGHSPDYLLQLGPYGVFAWAAWMMRGALETLKNGIQVSIVHRHELTHAGIESLRKVLNGTKDNEEQE